MRQLREWSACECGKIPGQLAHLCTALRWPPGGVWLQGFRGPTGLLILFASRCKIRSEHTSELSPIWQTPKWQSGARWPSCQIPVVAILCGGGGGVEWSQGGRQPEGGSPSTLRLLRLPEVLLRCSVRSLQ